MTHPQSIREGRGDEHAPREVERAPAQPQRTSRLTRIHAVLFSTGVLALLTGIVFRMPTMLVVSGPCLSFSGILIWVGSRITFKGPVGDALRLALGRRRVLTLHARAVIWLIVGLVVTGLGIHRLREAPVREVPPLRPPVAALGAGAAGLAG